jgi:hypothetical protein
MINCFSSIRVSFKGDIDSPGTKNIDSYVKLGGELEWIRYLERELWL